MAADETFSRVGASIWLCLLRLSEASPTSARPTTLPDVWRSICPDCSAPTALYSNPFVRDDATRPDLLRMSVCEWLFFPLAHAPGDSSARKLLEKQWIKKIGTLNPPRVHVLARARSGLRPPHAGLAIFDAPRPVLRLRKVQKLDRPVRHSVAQLALKSWKDGLRFTAAALAGHQFAGCKAAALSVWRLPRSAWIWVVTIESPYLPA